MSRWFRSWRRLASPPPAGGAAVVLVAAVAALGALRPAAADPAAPPGRQATHPVRIVHPGDANGVPTEHTLVQSLDRDGEPAAYSMWVDSVICHDQTCKVVKVRLHWDRLGRYQRYEVAPGSQLTKLDHIPFTQADLDRLHEILSDPDSPLREIDKESMTGSRRAPSHRQSADVDAVSSPTILTLKTAVVIGAGYTCYDLWHWANSLLTGEIRRLTGAGSSTRQLRADLAGKDADAVLLALEYLPQRGPLDRPTIDAVTAAGRRGPADLVAPVLACLEQAAPDAPARDDAILEIFSAADSRKRTRILEALLAAPRGPSPAFCDRLCDHLPGLDTYFEVHLFLSLMNRRNPDSAKVTRQAAGLLDHDHFFVSRRAYQHLAPRDLPADLRKRVDAYEELHRDRL